MNQGCRLQGLARALSGQPLICHLAQLRIDAVKQVISCVRISLFHSSQQTRDLRHTSIIEHTGDTRDLAALLS